MHRAIAAVEGETPKLYCFSVSERATAHRLALHLDKKFPGWNVDCEYNRDEQLTKKLMGIAGCNARKPTDIIVPDIIVHRRGSTGPTNNLLVVELKRNTPNDPCDTAKLELLTGARDHYQYQFGLYVNIARGAFELSWYINGAMHGPVEQIPAQTEPL